MKISENIIFAGVPLHFATRWKGKEDKEANMSRTTIIRDNIEKETRKKERNGGATLQEIKDFFEYCKMYKDTGKVGRYEVYRFWARSLRHTRTPYKKHGIFDFHEGLKWYMRAISNGDIVDANAPLDAVVVPAENFVRNVVRYVDEAF